MGTERIARKVWAAIFNSVALGLCDDISPGKLKLILDPIRTGSTGDKLVLGRRVIGLEGTIDLELREIDRDTQELLNTHYSSGDSIPLTPPKNTDTYTLAALLTLHPVENGADVSEDVNLLKAYALTPVQPDRAGKQDDMMKVSFEAYPLRTDIDADGTITYGYVGPIPA